MDLVAGARHHWEKREIKVRKAGSTKRKVQMETLKCAVVRRPKVRSEPDVRTLTKLTPQCRFVALQKEVITYLTDFKCRRTGRNRTKAQWKREGLACLPAPRRYRVPLHAHI